MANLSKMTKASCNNLFNHYERKNGIKFGNQDINKERSYMNYNLAPIKNLSQNEILNNRLAEVKVLKRDDVNVMCSWIITLPKTIKEDSKEEYRFFEKSYEFLKNEYGEKNIISSYVHKDEKTPHMHFAFIPVVIDKKKGIEKVSAYELFTRLYLQKFHTRLSEYLNEYFKRDIGILNGATVGGNKTVLELKNKSLEKEISKKKLDIEKASQEKEYIINLVNSTQLKFLDLIKRVKKRDIEVEELEEINKSLEKLKAELNSTPIFNIIKKNKLKKEQVKLKENYDDKEQVVKIKEKTINKVKQEILDKIRGSIKVGNMIEVEKLENSICNDVGVISEIVDDTNFKVVFSSGQVSLVNALRDEFNIMYKDNEYSNYSTVDRSSESYEEEDCELDM